MTTWKKLINSGSNAHVASLNISDTPSEVPSSLKSEGTVFFSALPVQPVPNDLPVGTLMKSVSPAVDGGLSRYVMISNNFVATTGADFVIPPNGTAIACDLNQDGTVSTGDLLILLGDFGTVGENMSADFDSNGVVNTQDLLIFLSAFGTNLYDSFGTYYTDSDTRPFIDWGNAQYNYIQVVDEGDNITHSWVNDDGYATVDSVTTLYNTIVQYESNDYFWDTFLPNGEVVGTSVKLYITQMEALTVPLFEVFIYIYFSQESGTGFISGDFSGGEQTPIEGGHDVFNRTGISWGTAYIAAPSYPNSPVGYYAL
tara:strand:- start:645 stop:1583 length:939 start_codon:yes stop_codon:yes gene_type:complete